MSFPNARLCDQYCIFHVGKAEFAVSAASVREVADLVPIVDVPHSAPVLKGLCHHRNEFLPVLSLPALLSESTTQDVHAHFLLVMEGVDGPWALPITRAVGLESLEMASIGETAGETLRELVMGTASFRDSVVRILDADRLYQSAVDVLCDVWTSRDGRGRVPEHAAAFQPLPTC
ncbi:MAG: chemotaxis protein CheW [Planctomycetaceae bacterium]|nr:chemotaxis protein CheW [Planctomycetaceae bacterium]